MRNYQALIHKILISIISAWWWVKMPVRWILINTKWYSEENTYHYHRLNIDLKLAWWPNCSAKYQYLLVFIFHTKQIYQEYRMAGYAHHCWKVQLSFKWFSLVKQCSNIKVILSTIRIITFVSSYIKFLHLIKELWTSKAVLSHLTLKCDLDIGPSQMVLVHWKAHYGNAYEYQVIPH